MMNMKKKYRRWYRVFPLFYFQAGVGDLDQPMWDPLSARHKAVNREMP